MLYHDILCYKYVSITTITIIVVLVLLLCSINVVYNNERNVLIVYDMLSYMLS